MGFKGITCNTPAEQPAHCYAQDDAALYHGIFGADYVLNQLDCFKATVLNNNKVRIGSGAAVCEGHLGRIEYGDYEDVVIENGISGKNRNDLIVLRFLTTGSTGSDSYKIQTIKGTAGATAVDPSFVAGSLLAGDAQRDFPLYRVRIEGTSIVAIERLFTVSMSLEELNSKLKYSPWTFTKVINPNNLPYCTVIFLNDVRNHYNDQTITPHDVCCTICNGDWNSAQIGVRCAVYQNEAYVALLDGTLNIPIRINGTITVNR